MEDDSAARMTRGSLLKRGGVVAGAAALSGGLVPTAFAREAAVNPRKGGRMAIATPSLASDLFLGNSFGLVGEAFSQYGTGLFTFRPGTLDPVESLAESYVASKDRLTHDIKLKSGLTFHDGSPIDAAAVVACFRSQFLASDTLRGPGPHTQIANFWGGSPGNLRRLRALNKRTVRIVLRDRRADIRWLLAIMPVINPRVMAVSPRGYGTNVDLLRKIGSGPFRVTDFQPGQFVRYERFPDFPVPAYLDRLELRLVSDPSARFLALKSGAVQVAVAPSRADYESVRGDNNYRRFAGNLGNNIFCTINVKRTPALKNRKVREALLRAMNRPAYVKAFWAAGTARIGTQVCLTPGSIGYNESLKPVPYDRDGAARLLREAGVTSLSLVMIDPPSFGPVPELGAMLTAIASDFKAVGVDLKITTVDLVSWLSRNANSFDLSITSFGNNGVPEPTVSLYFLTKLYQIPPYYKYPGLIAAANRSLSTEARERNLSDLMALSMENVVGLPIAYSAGTVVSSRKVHDMAVGTAPYNYAGVWVER